jgi:hypothetical protein
MIGISATYVTTPVSVATVAVTASAASTTNFSNITHIEENSTLISFSLFFGLRHGQENQGQE